MNSGKRFEQNFKKSVPNNVFFYRFRDGTANWQHNDLVRFQQKNICDCMIFDGEMLFLLELKNHKGKSLPLSCIRDNQIKELSLNQIYKNVKCGIVINFEELNECYFMFICDITDFIRKSDRKSIPIDYCREKGIKIANKRLRTNYKYDIENLLKDIESNLN